MNGSRAPLVVLVTALFGVAFYLLMRPQGELKPVAGSSHAATLAPGLFVEVEAADIQALIKKSPVTLVNIWATWCEPCKEEFPHLLAIRKKYLDQGLSVLFVSADFATQKNEATQFLAEHAVDFKTYHKQDDDAGLITALYPDWTGAIPATLIFNQKGERLHEWQGSATLEQFDLAVQQALHPAK